MYFFELLKQLPPLLIGATITATTAIGLYLLGLFQTWRAKNAKMDKINVILSSIVEPMLESFNAVKLETKKPALTELQTYIDDLEKRLFDNDTLHTMHFDVADRLAKLRKDLKKSIEYLESDWLSTAKDTTQYWSMARASIEDSSIAALMLLRTVNKYQADRSEQRLIERLRIKRNKEQSLKDAELQATRRARMLAPPLPINQVKPSNNAAPIAIRHSKGDDK